MAEDSREGIRHVLGFRRFRISSFMLGLCWRLLHLVISTVHMVLFIANTLESYLISSILSQRYKVLQLNKLRYLAIVVDSEEAVLTSRIIKLLQWLSAIGVTHVSLYDMEGVLKQNKEMLLKNLTNTKPWEEADKKANNLNQEKMTLEFLSISDGKEGAAKAANFLCSKYLNATSLGGNQIEPVFTEADMDNALKEVGCGGPDPNLLLIYGAARCHLGFPAWRMRYTEIVHMGMLKSMKYGAIIKVIHKFTMVHQNYGS
ncbi:undecaprenyl pyrophosphate synthetase family protein isoform X2 [Tasmannia lanceolata]|uniref:undecaprenyl pyrophosphate synthetase family protein isoform X2 n=1 Tax=Tasmannia lanceolata TaxID=3420 RepID=UPI004064247F